MRELPRYSTDWGERCSGAGAQLFLHYVVGVRVRVNLIQ